MSTTTNSHSTICLPAHILDARITPRSREVLMLLASQTSVKSPALWICQATIAERLRCSVATVARAIQKLVAEKLIAETGRLYEGRYKIYHVRWSGDENLKAVSKKITNPIRKVVTLKTKKTTAMPVEGVQLILPPVAEVEVVSVAKLFEQLPALPPMTSPPQTMSPPSTITPHAIIKDSRFAYFAEVARKRHEESRRLHQSILRSLQ